MRRRTNLARTPPNCGNKVLGTFVMHIKVRTRTSRVRAPRPWAVATWMIAASVGACGGDDGDNMMPVLPPTSSLGYGVSDPCAAAATPTPSDLFFDEAGRAGLDGCPLPMDPLDAAVAIAERDQRAPLIPDIVLPIDGTIDFSTLSSTVTISFDGRSNGSGLPSIVLFELTGTSSVGGDWRVVDIMTTPVDGAIQLVPSRALLPDRLHVVVATRALRDAGTPQQALVPSPAVTALVGGSPIAAGAFQGLDAEGAARLERMRTTLQGALSSLEKASPPVAASDIVSIHAFTTRSGANLVPNVAAKYQDALRAGLYRYEVVVEERDIAPAQIYGNNVPASAYPNVGSFIRGVIKAPRLLDDDVRLRANWDTVAQTVDIPFLLSIPRQGATYPVAVQVVGFGRSALDARSLANAVGGGPRGSVLAIELRCHGRRSPNPGTTNCVENRSAADAMTLLDQVSNNANPEFMGPDGIPDDSGVGYFPGDPRKLRDSQVAATIEIMHVVGSLRDASAWTDEMIPVDRNGIHLLAQGYTSIPAGAAAAYIANNLRVRTLQFLSGGSDLAALILGSGEDQRRAFDGELPGGIGGGQAETLLIRLQDYLAPVQMSSYAMQLVERFTPQGSIRGILLAHPSDGSQGVTQYVSSNARASLVSDLTLPSMLVSQHRARCDNYFLYTCQLGQEISILEQAQAQVAGFINSNGFTFPDPG